MSSKSRRDQWGYGVRGPNRGDSELLSYAYIGRRGNTPDRSRFATMHQIVSPITTMHRIGAAIRTLLRIEAGFGLKSAAASTPGHAGSPCTHQSSALASALLSMRAPPVPLIRLSLLKMKQALCGASCGPT
jgi:hypothetical protein